MRGYLGRGFALPWLLDELAPIQVFQRRGVRRELEGTRREWRSQEPEVRYSFQLETPARRTTLGMSSANRSKEGLSRCGRECREWQRRRHERYRQWCGASVSEIIPLSDIGGVYVGDTYTQPDTLISRCSGQKRAASLRQRYGLSCGREPPDIRLHDNSLLFETPKYWSFLPPPDHVQLFGSERPPWGYSAVILLLTSIYFTEE